MRHSLKERHTAITRIIGTQATKASISSATVTAFAVAANIIHTASASLTNIIVLCLQIAWGNTQTADVPADVTASNNGVGVNVVGVTVAEKPFKAWCWTSNLTITTRTDNKRSLGRHTRLNGDISQQSTTMQSNTQANGSVIATHVTTEDCDICQATLENSLSRNGHRVFLPLSKHEVSLRVPNFVLLNRK